MLTRKTLGGLHTDLSSRVLSPTGEPVPGLYAAGDAAGFDGGGMHGYRSLEGAVPRRLPVLRLLRPDRRPRRCGGHGHVERLEKAEREITHGALILLTESPTPPTRRWAPGGGCPAESRTAITRRRRMLPLALSAGEGGP